MRLVLMSVCVIAALIFMLALVTSKRPGRGSVCVLMYSTPNVIPEYAGIAATINEAYAKRHGYAFRHVIRENTTGLVPAWNRVWLIREALDDFDAVFYIDGDAAFNVHHKPLDEFLRMPADFVGCSDNTQGTDVINGGALLIKSSPWSKRFVDAWWTLRHVPKFKSFFSYEQAALSHMLRNNTCGCDTKVQVLRADAFNSSYADIMRGRRDTFVLHFMAMDAATRREELTKIATRLGL